MHIDLHQVTHVIHAVCFIEPFSISIWCITYVCFVPPRRREELYCFITPTCYHDTIRHLTFMHKLQAMNVKHKNYQELWSGVVLHVCRQVLNPLQTTSGSGLSESRFNPLECAWTPMCIRCEIIQRALNGH